MVRDRDTGVCKVVDVGRLTELIQAASPISRWFLPTPTPGAPWLAPPHGVEAELHPPLRCLWETLKYV